MMPTALPIQIKPQDIASNSARPSCSSWSGVARLGMTKMALPARNSGTVELGRDSCNVTQSLSRANARTAGSAFPIGPSSFS